MLSDFLFQQSRTPNGFCYEFIGFIVFSLIGLPKGCCFSVTLFKGGHLRPSGLPERHGGRLFQYHRASASAGLVMKGREHVAAIELVGALTAALDGGGTGYLENMVAVGQRGAVAAACDQQRSVAAIHTNIGDVLPAKGFDATHHSGQQP